MGINRNWIVGLFLGFGFAFATLAIAQEQTNLDKFKAVNAEILGLLDTQRKLVGEYPSASDERKKQIETEFEQAKGTQAEKMVAWRDTALAAYKDGPNADQAVVDALYLIARDDYQMDRYDAAKEIAELLVANNATKKGLSDLLGSVYFCTNEFTKSKEAFDKAVAAGELSIESQRFVTEVDKYITLWQEEEAKRAEEATANDLPRVQFETSKGNIVIELFENQAPDTVGNFISLIEAGFYDGVVFHRVLPGFMAQGGDPKGTGSGGPGYSIYCECTRDDYRKHFAGTLSMAHAGKNTGGSQFFLTFRPTPHLDGKHTAFGRIIEGMDVLAKLQRINPGQPRGETPDKIVKATVLRKRDHVYAPNKVR